MSSNMTAFGGGARKGHKGGLGIRSKYELTTEDIGVKVVYDCLQPGSTHCKQSALARPAARHGVINFSDMCRALQHNVTFFAYKHWIPAPLGPKKLLRSLPMSGGHLRHFSEFPYFYIFHKRVPSTR